MFLYDNHIVKPIDFVKTTFKTITNWDGPVVWDHVNSIFHKQMLKNQKDPYRIFLNPEERDEFLIKASQSPKGYSQQIDFVCFDKEHPIKTILHAEYNDDQFVTTCHFQIKNNLNNYQIKYNAPERIIFAELNLPMSWQALKVCDDEVKRLALQVEPAGMIMIIKKRRSIWLFSTK